MLVKIKNSQQFIIQLALPCRKELFCQLDIKRYNFKKSRRKLRCEGGAENTDLESQFNRAICK